MLLHNNAGFHSAGLTQSMLMKLKLNVLTHPAHSPDLSPCDYEVFGPMKKFLEGKRFSTEEKVSQGMDVTSLDRILERCNV